MGVFGLDVHEIRYRSARLAYSKLLEPFPYLEEQHHSSRFGIHPDSEGAERSDAHQEVLVEEIPMSYVACSPQQHVVAYDEVGDAEKCEI